jgi:signal peptidase
VVAIVLAAVCTYVSFVSTSGNGVPSILGVRPFTVQTDSMYPILKPGDLIIDVAVKDYRELRVGDIITYWTIIEGQRVLNTHKIAGIYDGGDYLIFETMGEKVNQTDVLTVHESEIVGIYKFRVPGVGKVLDYLQTPTGFMIVIVLPVLLFFVFHLVQFFRVLFEYQNVKMLIKYEQERGRTEDLIESQIRDEKAREEIRRAAMEKERAEMEAKLREELRAELLADMVKNNGKDSSASDSEEKK